jgi:hypothetical protein
MISYFFFFAALLQVYSQQGTSMGNVTTIAETPFSLTNPMAAPNATVV